MTPVVLAAGVALLCSMAGAWLVWGCDRMPTFVWLPLALLVMAVGTAALGFAVLSVTHLLEAAVALWAIAFS